MSGSVLQAEFIVCGVPHVHPKANTNVPSCPPGPLRRSRKSGHRPARVCTNTSECASIAPQTEQEGCGHLGQSMAGFMASCLVLLSSGTAVGSETAPTVQQSQEEGLTIKFRASKDPSIRKAQEALVETWGYVTTQYLDTNFNGVDWQKQLQVFCSESLTVIISTAYC